MERVIIAVNFPIQAIGKRNSEKKNQGFNGIRTRDLRDTGAMPYQLSFEATHWERGRFIGKYELNKLTSLQMCGFKAHLVDHRYRGGLGFESR